MAGWDQVKRERERERFPELNVAKCLLLTHSSCLVVVADLSVLRELRHEGLLMEQHNKPRQVLLFETMLIITKQKEDGRLQFKSLITVSCQRTSTNPTHNLQLSSCLPPSIS